MATWAHLSIRVAAWSTLLLVPALTALAQEPPVGPRAVRHAAHSQGKPAEHSPDFNFFAAPTPSAVDGPGASAQTGLRLHRPESRAGQTSPDESRAPSATASAWTTAAALSFVVVLIVGMASVWKRYAGRLPAVVGTDVIEVLGRRPIDQRQSILLVRCGARILILGSSPGGFQTLAEVTDPTEIDYLAGLCKSSGNSGVVAQTFRQLLSQGSRPNSAAPPTGVAQSLATRLGLKSALSPKPPGERRA